jgi:hypothetical protein
MRYLFWMTVVLIIGAGVQAQAMELGPLVDCSLKVFRDINRSRIWSGKTPAGCAAEVYVEKRPTGIFVSAWSSSRSKIGWERLTLSSAMGFAEVANKKQLEKASRGISARAARIGRCLDSIIRVNDPLECRDYATKTYNAGDEVGVEYNRDIWLNDTGRHSVVEYAYGDTDKVVSPPADLFGGPALPPGIDLKVHVFDSN